VEWCIFPPILGPAIGAFMGGPTMISVFNVRGGGSGGGGGLFGGGGGGGGGIQVEVDKNARKA